MESWSFPPLHWSNEVELCSFPTMFTYIRSHTSLDRILKTRATKDSLCPSPGLLSKDIPESLLSFRNLGQVFVRTRYFTLFSA